MESIRRASKQSFIMGLVAAVLVAAAAPIEAFVSPSSLPWWVKASVACLCLLVVVLYVVVLGGVAQRRKAMR